MRANRAHFLSNPSILWQLFFYMLPLALMVWLSLRPESSNGLGSGRGIESYSIILSTSRFAEAIANSVRLGLISAIAAVGFGLPLAYALHRYCGVVTRRWLLPALALPFFSSYVLRMYGWQAWVSRSGVLAWLGRNVLGLQDASGFLFTETAAVVGLLSVLIPIATLVISLSLSRIDPTLVAAARNLGASAWTSFVKIELPFTMPAIFVGFLFCFLLAFGDFVCVTILGGNQTYYYSNAIQDQMKVNDWALASALGVLLLLLSVVCMAITFTLVGRTGAARAQAHIEAGQ